MSHDATLTTQAVMDRLGIGKPKLRFWVQSIGLEPHKDGSGAWRFTSEQVEALELTKTLREVDDRTMETVRRVIAQRRAPAVVQQVVEPATSEERPRSASAAPAQQLDFTPIIAQLERLAEAQADAAPEPAALASAIAQALAPHLAETTRLQTEVAAALRELADARGELAEAQRDRAAIHEAYANARHMMGRLEGEKNAVAAQLSEARALLAAPPPSKPWWKVW